MLLKRMKRTELKGGVRKYEQRKECEGVLRMTVAAQIVLPSDRLNIADVCLL